MMKTIDFYSYKGGVGRTMIAAQFARALAAMGKRVVVADFDFEAPGIHTPFRVEPSKVKGGLYELASPYLISRGDDSEFCRQLENFLIPVELDLKGDSGTGAISLLSCGRIDNDYFGNVSSPEWQEFLSHGIDSHKPSFVRIMQRTLKDSLARLNDGAGFDYLIIDARSGTTYYGGIGRYIANSYAVAFCWNGDSKYALRNHLIPALNKFQTERLASKADAEKYHYTLNGLPLERVAFIMTRMPPEIKESEDKFDNAREWIFGESSNLLPELKEIAEIVQFHSDLETSVNPDKYVLDGCFKLDADGKRKKDVVPLHEDLFTILAALCPELYDEIEGDAKPGDTGGGEVSLSKKVNSLWREIFGDELRITRTNRLFGFHDTRGEIINPDDNNRNVAFKVETFLNFLNTFHDTLKAKFENDIKWKEAMDEALLEAGRKCGGSFGSAFNEWWEKEKSDGIETSDNQTQKLERWCSFDTQAGFGLMEYHDATKILKVVNPFILNTKVTNGQDYSAFFSGYVIGVLEELLDDNSNVSQYVEMTTICESSDIIGVGFKPVLRNKRYSGLPNYDSAVGILYRFEGRNGNVRYKKVS
jgi:hypothetical protein